MYLYSMQTSTIKHLTLILVHAHSQQVDLKRRKQRMKSRDVYVLCVHVWSWQHATTSIRDFANNLFVCLLSCLLAYINQPFLIAVHGLLRTWLCVNRSWIFWLCDSDSVFFSHCLTRYPVFIILSLGHLGNSSVRLASNQASLIIRKECLDVEGWWLHSGLCSRKASFWKIRVLLQWRFFDRENPLHAMRQQQEHSYRRQRVLAFLTQAWFRFLFPCWVMRGIFLPSSKSKGI